MNRSLVFVKPDAVRRKLIGKIIERFEDAGLKIIALKMLTLSKGMAGKHYAEHEGKEFYENLLKFVTSGPIVAMILEGDKNVISKVRDMVGATDPKEAEPGTIRGDFKEQPVKSVTENMIHASDSEKSAKREITLFFGLEYTA